MSNFLLSVEMQNSSLYMVKSVIVKSVKIAANVKALAIWRHSLLRLPGYQCPIKV
jgi:hypothetical protein